MPFIMAAVLIDMISIVLIIPVLPPLVGSFTSSQSEQAFWYGAVTIALSVLIFLVNAVSSWRGGEVAGANPWSSSGLEWAMPSPPPAYNFVHTPVVHSRHPLWDTTVELPVVAGLRTDRREVLLTTAFDARPDARHLGHGG